jgi:hypothetical protein
VSFDARPDRISHAASLRHQDQPGRVVVLPPPPSGSPYFDTPGPVLFHDREVRPGCEEAQTLLFARRQVVADGDPVYAVGIELLAADRPAPLSSIDTLAVWRKPALAAARDSLVESAGEEAAPDVRRQHLAEGRTRMTSSCVIGPGGSTSSMRIEPLL